MSSTMPVSWASLSARPWILARTASRLAGGVAGVTLTRLPAGSAKRRKAGSARPSSSAATRPSSVSSSVASMLRELLRSSTREKPRNTSGRSAVERREITTTFSRPVSRLMRQIFRRGRAGLAMAQLFCNRLKLFNDFHDRRFGWSQTARREPRAVVAVHRTDLVTDSWCGLEMHQSRPNRRLRAYRLLGPGPCYGTRSGISIARRRSAFAERVLES